MTMRRISMGFAISLLLAGCHGNPFRAVGENCHKPQVYQRAGSAAPLKVPDGADAPNVAGALVIPSVDAAAPPPGLTDPCLDEPPRYKPAPPVRPASAPAPASGAKPSVQPTPAPAPFDAAPATATPSDKPAARTPADAAPANGPIPPVIPPPQPAPVDAAPGSAPIT